MKIAIAGYTGLIGSHLLDLAKRDSSITEIIALGRKEPEHHATLRFVRTDFEQVKPLEDALQDVNAIFCCLGTTIKTAGSKEAFAKVDLSYVANLAHAAANCGVKQMAVVSAIGADARSSIFYNKVKGEMEFAVKNSGIPKVYIFQPSLLFGNRKEFRFGERVGSAVMRLLSPVMLGGMKKYKPIKASIVAKAMKRAVEMNLDSRQFQYKEMSELAK